LQIKKLSGCRLTVFRLTEDTSPEGEHLIGAKHERIGRLVLTFASLEFGECVDHVSG
jgi:hypothetical protein